MKILVFSDSHGHTGDMIEIIDKQKDIDLVIHLGDVVSDAEDIESIFPQIKILYVRGNCDFYETRAKEVIIVSCENKNIMLTHGHKYGVKYDYEKIYNVAKKNNVDILLFGHTHIPFIENREDLCIMNPGSIAGIRSPKGPTYGQIDIEKDGKIHMSINLKNA